MESDKILRSGLQRTTLPGDFYKRSLHGQMPANATRSACS